MGPKQFLVLLSVAFASYLTFSTTLVSAYSIAKAGTGLSFIIEPELKITDGPAPIKCDSSGYITLHAYVDNVEEFDIEDSKAFVEDLSWGQTFDVSSALSCMPESGLISNEEITCKLHIRELLSQIPACPMEKAVNRLYLTLEISYGNRKATVSDEKSFVITESGTEPSLEIDFSLSHPYEMPEINCITGSEIDVPVLIKHAEVLFGEMEWLFSIGENTYGGNLIECEKRRSAEGEGREDIYVCTLLISDALFTDCSGGEEEVVVVYANSGEHSLQGSFSTLLDDRPLDLSLSISGIDTLECQIIDEKGTCVPKEPQQNVTATIRGNVPARLKVIGTSYTLGDSGITNTYCRKISYKEYECLAFITADGLDMPSTKDDTTEKSRELEFFFDVKYLNYYTNISDSTEVMMEGSVISEALNTVNVLEKKKGILEWILDNKVMEWLERGFRTIDFISGCCFLTELLLQLTTGSLKEALNQLLKTYLWGSAKGAIDKVTAVLVSYGPSILDCIVERGMETIKEEQENLQDFEEGEITSEMEIPSLVSLIESHVASCAGESIWDRIKQSWKKWLCAAIAFASLVITQGGSAAALSAICEAMESPAIRVISTALNLLLMAVTYLLMNQTFSQSMESIALSRERINLQVKAHEILSDYSDSLANTMDTLAGSISSNLLLQNITSPSYDTVKLLFISDRTGILDNGDEICTGDEIKIEYNFEKLNQTEGFVSRLLITPGGRGPLVFDELEGTHGPTETNLLLGTDPSSDPPEPYTFKLSYQGKSLDYVLNYVPVTCE